VVQRGDNLFRIALRFGTTVRALMRANKLWLPWIWRGQTLIIPGGCGPTPQPKPTEAVHHSDDDQPKPVSTESHSGDDQHKTAPTDNQSGSPTPGARPRAQYTVKAGDNLFRIGLKYGVSVSALQAANGLSSTYIRVGQVLVIP
jgi:LysM repeat protein